MEQKVVAVFPTILTCDLYVFTFLVSSSAQLVNFLLKLVIPSTSASRVNLEQLMILSLLLFVCSFVQEVGLD